MLLCYEDIINSEYVQKPFAVKNSEKIYLTLIKNTDIEIEYVNNIAAHTINFHGTDLPLSW